jgi:endonuclease/exonuclease/phosphatase family metal-dependent hydrolase
MDRHVDKPYHLDYAFVSTRAMGGARLTIGAPSEWLRLSDHMPLLLDLEI